MKVCNVLFLLLLLTVEMYGAKILGIFNFPSKSHHILGESLLKALAVKGHDVTMLSPFRTNAQPENYKELLLPELIKYKDENMTDIIANMQNQTELRKRSSIVKHVSALEEIFFNHDIIRSLISTNRRFDLAIVSWFGNDAILALSHHVANLTIAFSTIGATYSIKKLTNVPIPYSYVPNVFPSFPDEMTFTDRLGNTLSFIIAKMVDLFIGFHENAVIKKYIPNAPSSYDLFLHVSLVFLNTHYSIESPRPYVPNMIQVGGLHLEEPKELTDELKHFMDEGNEGVILFSLGTNVKSDVMSHEKIVEIAKCFSKLPYKVLWKFETGNISNLPNNVRIGKWFPQRDLLAHRNLQLFITHGGLLSIIESVHYGVPMIGIPMIGDQEANVNDGAVRGYLLRLPLKRLSEQTLCNAVLEVMHNSRYRKNVQFRSHIFRDQPLKPIDRAIFWVEYALRHNGAHHLKTSALKLWWYQQYLLDVIAVIGLVLIGVIFTAYRVFKFLYRRSTQKVSAKN